MTRRLGKTKTVLLQKTWGKLLLSVHILIGSHLHGRDQLGEEVCSLAEIGILKPSFSPWSSPMVPVQKPDESVTLFFLILFLINAMTTPDPCLMPRVNDMLIEIGNTKFLMKMDLNNEFHQIPRLEEDQCKVVFFTPWGKWQYAVMPLGLLNTPAIFQHLIHIILADISSFANAYMDEIVTFSNNWDKHLIHIDIILNRFQQHGLIVKPSKYQWGSTSIEILGHVAGYGHISVPDCRVKVIRDYKKLVN